MELKTKKKPKAILKVRVYRAKTGKWESPKEFPAKVIFKKFKQLINR